MYVPFEHTTSNSTEVASNPCSSIRWIVMRRGARATSSPRRAISFSGRPACFNAEYIGGTWSRMPASVASVLSSRARSMVGIGAERITSPSASPVVVAAPSASRAR
jgi:hypothetical protein